MGGYTRLPVSFSECTFRLKAATLLNCATTIAHFGESGGLRNASHNAIYPIVVRRGNQGQFSTLRYSPQRNALRIDARLTQQPFSCLLNGLDRYESLRNPLDLCVRVCKVIQ